MAVDKQVRGLASLLTLIQRARNAATKAEILDLLVNETALLTQFRTAFVFDAKKKRISAVSGLPTPVSDAVFTPWATRFGRKLHKHQQPQLRFHVDEVAAPGDRQRAELVPEYGAWISLTLPEMSPLGGLVLFRDTAFKEEEVRILTGWVEAATQALCALDGKRAIKRRNLKSALLRTAALTCLVGAVAALWYPVPLRAVAPVEIVASHPAIIKSPLDGVIETVAVSPNQTVVPGDLLIRLDDRALQADMAVATQDLEIARAELRQAQQSAVRDRDAQAMLPILEARIRQREAQRAFAAEQMARLDITSPMQGIALIADAEELEGRPLSVGERILTIAAPDRVKARLLLPVGAQLPDLEGAPASLFLNVRPEQPWQARVTRSDYHAEQTETGDFAFSLDAELLPEQDPVSLGWRGTAHVMGDQVPLYYFLFRRPFAEIRQWLGL